MSTKDMNKLFENWRKYVTEDQTNNLEEVSAVRRDGSISIDLYELTNLAMDAMKGGRSTVEIEVQDHTVTDSPEPDVDASMAAGKPTYLSMARGGPSSRPVTLTLQVLQGLPRGQVRPNTTMTGAGEMLLRPEELGQPFSVPGLPGNMSFQVDREDLQQLAEQHGWQIS
jgi:hypothetical protein